MYVYLLRPMCHIYVTYAVSYLEHQSKTRMKHKTKHSLKGQADSWIKISLIFSCLHEVFSTPYNHASTTSMNSIKTFVVALVACTVTGASFVPAVVRQAPQTTLAFGFLKELGLEKPSWLPDFGGKKDKTDEPATEEPVSDASKDQKEENAEAPAE